MGAEVLSTECNDALPQLLRGAPGHGAGTKADFGANAGVMVAGQQSEHSPKGMTYDRNTLSVHARRSLQKRQPGKRVIELTADYQLVVQLPAGLGAPSLSLLEKVLREGALVGRKALATTAEVKKT